MQRRAVGPQDDVSLKKSFERIGPDVYKKAWKKRIAAILIVLGLAFLALTIFGVNVDLSQPVINRIGTGIALLITSVPAVLQLRDWALPDSLRKLTIDGIAGTPWRRALVLGH